MNDVLSRPLPPARVRTRVIVTAAALDVAVVLAFAASGRASHGEAVDAAGVAHTALPFLVALALSWLVLRAWRRPLRVWPTGLGLWLGTWAAGMGLRALTGGGTALAFVLVALGVLGLGLLGWRVLARLLGVGGSTYPGLAQH